jgi:hypothetical protein
MGPFSLAAVIVTGTIIAGMGINALQNWHNTMYSDAFQQHHPMADTSAMRNLANKERDIDRLMRTQDFVTEREDN